MGAGRGRQPGQVGSTCPYPHPTGLRTHLSWGEEKSRQSFGSGERRAHPPWVLESRGGQPAGSREMSAARASGSDCLHSELLGVGDNCPVFFPITVLTSWSRQKQAPVWSYSVQLCRLCTERPWGHAGASRDSDIRVMEPRGLVPCESPPIPWTPDVTAGTAYCILRVDGEVEAQGSLVQRVFNLPL